jgi:excisionase family DNA binding protein
MKPAHEHGAPDRDEILTATEVADWLKLTPVVVSRKADKGELPGFKWPGGREWRFRRSAIERWLKEGRVANVG